jgi:hypothetical protein
VAATVGAALLGTNLLAATSARADSSDCAGWGPQQGIAIGATIPSGVYCFGVDGSGHQVLDTYGKYYFTSITLHAALYHEREVVRFYDKKNANYATFMEPAYPGWRYGNVTMEHCRGCRPPPGCGWGGQRDGCAGRGLAGRCGRSACGAPHAAHRAPGIACISGLPDDYSEEVISFS